MKHSIILAAVTLSFINPAYAETPASEVSHDVCMGWAHSQGDRGVSQDAGKRCSALEKCRRNQSTDRESLTECYYTAEKNFAIAIGKLRSKGADISRSDFAVPAVTEKADSTLYERKGGDSKGWENATLGD